MSVYNTPTNTCPECGEIAATDDYEYIWRENDKPAAIFYEFCPKCGHKWTTVWAFEIRKDD